MAEGPRLVLSVVGLGAHKDLPVRATLRRWVLMALEREAQVCLVFAGAAQGRRLNREFRGRDYATNVLTFSYRLRPEVVADVVLCVPVLRREARAAGRTLREHLAHLVLHGVLHAQGYEHERGGRAARRMQDREIELLARLRIANPYVEVNAS